MLGMKYLHHSLPWQNHWPLQITMLILNTKHRLLMKTKYVWNMCIQMVLEWHSVRQCCLLPYIHCSEARIACYFGWRPARCVEMYLCVCVILKFNLHCQVGSLSGCPNMVNLGLRPANERWRYLVTMFLIGWARALTNMAGFMLMRSQGLVSCEWSSVKDIATINLLMYSEMWPDPQDVILMA